MPLSLPSPVLTKTASMPNVELQLKLSPLAAVMVIVPAAVTTVSPVAGDLSSLASFQLWPPPNSTWKSLQVWLPSRDAWSADV